MQELYNLTGKDYGEIKAKDFEVFVCDILRKYGNVTTQVWVDNRYDGRRGRVDIIFNDGTKKIAIEIDRKRPRKKSVFKLHMTGADKKILMTRSPVSFTEIT